MFSIQDQHQNTVKIKIGSVCMITRNLDISDGLINGTCGVLQKVSCFEDLSKQEKIILWIEFDLLDVGTKTRTFYGETIKRLHIPCTWTPLCVSLSWYCIRKVDLTDEQYNRFHLQSKIPC